MTSPIHKAQTITPFWMQEIHNYDALEIHPVRDVLWDETTQGGRPFHADDNNEAWCEPCKPHEAHFWSVYGHLIQGGIVCFDDFATEADANHFATKLCSIYPHLQAEELLSL